MSLSEQFVEFFDVDIFRQKAKIKRKLREKEGIVIEKLSKWEGLSLKNKRRLQKQCLFLSQSYFALGSVFEQDKDIFSQAIEFLGKWQQTLPFDKGSVGVVNALLLYLNELKSSNIINNDILYAFKLTVFYQQLAVISLNSGSMKKKNHRLNLDELLETLSDPLDEKAITICLLNLKKKQGEKFTLSLLSAFDACEREQQRLIFERFYSKEMSAFINTLFFCKQDPSGVFPDISSSVLLVTLKQKAEALHTFYQELFRAFSIAKHSVLSEPKRDDLMLENLTQEKIIMSHALMDPQSLEDVLNLDVPPFKLESEFECTIKRFQLAYCTEFNVTLWFDVMFALGQCSHWKEKLVHSLRSLRLKTLLNDFHYLCDDGFSEVMKVLEQETNRVNRLEKVYANAIYLIKKYQLEINKRGFKTRPFSFESLAYDENMRVKHEDFLQRLESIYAGQPLKESEKLERLFCALESNT